MMSQQEQAGESEQWEASNNIEMLFNLLNDTRFKDALKLCFAVKSIKCEVPKWSELIEIARINFHDCCK